MESFAALRAERTTRVLIIDDNDVVRVGLQELLDGEPDMEVVGAAADGLEGLVRARALAPDIAVVDYGLEDMSGVEVSEFLARLCPDVAVIIVATFVTSDVARRSARSGAFACVGRDVSGAELKDAIRSQRGHAPGPADDRALHGPFGRRLDRGLSPREVDVLRLLAMGVPNSVIAEQMSVTENTVRTYVRRVCVKLGCRTRREAASVAAREGLL